MSAALTLLGSFLLMAGGVLLLTAAWGVLTLPDALSRQHAATKAGTLAVATVCAGALLLQPTWAWGWRLALLVGYLFVTLPLASFLLARAALREYGGNGDDVTGGPPAREIDVRTESSASRADRHTARGMANGAGQRQT